MSFLLPPLAGLPLPGTPEAIACGCTCEGSRGGLAGLVVPDRPVGRRPRFGAAKSMHYFYFLDCLVHGHAANQWIEHDSESEPTETAS